MTYDAVAFHVSRIEEQLQCHTFRKFYCNGSYGNTEAYVVVVTLIRKKKSVMSESNQAYLSFRSLNATLVSPKP
jgi:hypothetical protein